MARKSLSKWVLDAKRVIEPGTWLDTVETWMPKSMMICDPIIIGHDDENNVVVEWHYKGVIFTARMMRKWDGLAGKINVFAIDKIERPDKNDNS
jgi:hypothetical protein